EYWERLRKLNYDFLRDDLEKSISIALRFTLSVPGVHAAIVGTKKPERWEQNAKLLEAGPLDEPTFRKISERWEECATRPWNGHVRILWRTERRRIRGEGEQRGRSRNYFFRCG